MTSSNYLSAGDMSVFVSSPETAAKIPVVLVLQEAFGVNGHIRDVCQRFAQAGFLALAPELFHRQGKHVEVDYGDRKAFLPLMGSLTNEGILEDLRSTYDLAASLPQADLRNVFTVGFCLGGFASVLAATEFSLAGAVSFYGGGLVRAREGIGLRPILSQMKDIQVPLLFFFGKDDPSIPEEDRQRIQEQLPRSPHEIVIYENSNHGFFCDQRSSFNEAAAREAWAKTLAWLHAKKS